jgi:hypothetical protein
VIDNLPVPSMARPALNDRQISRMVFRIGLLQRRGMPENAAERWADRLHDRDMDGDDRRICLECANFTRSRTCFRRLPTSPDQLARCPGFEWQKP